MAGPIARAFVDIIARWKIEDPTGSVEQGLRQEIARIEGELDGLEGAARKAGAKVSAALDNIKLTLDARPAIAQITKLEEEADETIASLRALQRMDMKGFGGATKAATQIDRIDVAVKKLGLDLQKIDDETIVFDVAGAKRSLNTLEDAIAKLEVQLSTAKAPRVRIKTEEAIADLERLQDKVQAAVRSVTDLKGQTITVKVNDTDLTRVAAKVEELNQETIRINAVVDDKGTVDGMAGRVHTLNKNLLDFGDQFRNIAFRAVSYLAVGSAMSAFQRMISFGIEAAGEIQTVTVGLNRLFADMTELGSSASEFLGDLRKMAIETPFEFIDLADTSRRLIQLGGDSDLAIERMTALADAGAAVGATSQDINGVVRALSQMAAKGRINLQDLNQVAERLPNFQRQMQLRGVIQELEDMGSPLAGTIDSFEDLRAAGVPIETVINGIFRGLELIPGAAGAAAAQARTLEGALSNLKDFAQIEFASAFANVGVTLAEELNAAFSEIDGTVEGATSNMADGMREVIGALGAGMDQALPSVIGFFGEISGSLAGLLDAVGAVVESLASGFGGDFARGIIDGLTGVLNLFTALNEAASIFGEAFAAGLGQVATQMIALTRIGVNVFQPFQNLVNQGLQSLALYRGGIISARDAFSGLGAAAAGAFATAGAMVALTIWTNKMAETAKRSREVDQAINQATDSLNEFNDVGEAATAWLDNFREKGEGINLGGLERFADGVTTGEIETSLGLMNDELGDLVANLARTGGGFDSFEDGEAALRAAGVSMEDLDEAGGDVAISLAAAASQYAEAAKTSFEAAVATKRFGLVSEGTTKAIVEATEATGDYVTGMEDLEAANQAAAHVDFSGLVGQLNLTNAEAREVKRSFTDAETGTVDWVGAIGELNAQLLAVDDALLDLQDKAPAIFDIWDAIERGVPNTFRQGFIDIAQAVETAELTVQEFDALAREIGTSLTGEELKKRFELIGTVVDATTEKLGAVLPAIADIEIEAEKFSLKGFIDELGKIAEAQVKLEGNINGILDKFGETGAQAIQALIGSGLDKDQFAIAVQQLADKPALMEPLIAKFGEAGSTGAEQLAERLVSLGLSEEDAKAFIGLENFEAAGTAAGEAAGKAAGEKAGLSFGESLAASYKSRHGMLWGLTGDEEAPAAEAPGIDTEGQKAAATSAATEVSEAYGATLQSTLGTAFVGVNARLNELVKGMGSASNLSAMVAGMEVAKGLKWGFTAGTKDLGTVLKTQITAGTQQAVFTSIAVGTGAGKALSNAFTASAGPGMSAAFNQIATAMAQFGLRIAGIAQGAGAGAARVFGEGIDPMSDAMAREAVESIARALSMASTLMNIATKLGSAMTRAFDAGLNMAGVVAQEVVRVIGTMGSGALRGAASVAGFALGSAFGRGVAAGISAQAGAAAAAAARMVAAALAAAKRASGTASPSKVFAELGRNFGKGLAKGMLQSAPELQRAAALMSAAASGRAPAGGSIPASLSGGGASGTLALSGPGGTGIPSAPTARNYTNQFVINAPTDDPETLAHQVAVRLERRLES